MDLVRVGLERAKTAEEAVEVMGALLETHGQGGIADAAHQEAYDSSFLVADPDQVFVLDTAGSEHAAASFPAGTAISNRLSLGSEWGIASASLAPGEDFTRRYDAGRDTRYADVRLAASRAFLRAGPPGGLTPAATAAHMRDHGRGPWGAPRARLDAEPVPPPAQVGEDLSGVSVCMHVRDLAVTTSSMIARLPHRAGRDASLRAWVAAGSPCVSVYVPCFPRAASGPPPYVPLELSGDELWNAADRLRRRVEADPGALLEVRRVLDPVEDELWAEADEVADHPSRWAPTGAAWGARALHAMRTAL
jgi:hypothetical protein